MDICRTPEQTQETVELLAPFMPRAVVNELCSGRQYADYRERKRELQLAHVHFGMWYQRNVIAKQLARSQPKSRDGFRWLGTISDELEFSCRGKYGANCWSDPDFVKHTLKHTPESRAPKPATPFVVVNGFRKGFNNSRRSDGLITRPKSDRNTGAANGDRLDVPTAIARDAKPAGRPCSGGLAASKTAMISRP